MPRPHEVVADVVAAAAQVAKRLVALARRKDFHQQAGTQELGQLACVPIEPEWPCTQPPVPVMEDAEYRLFRNHGRVRLLGNPGSHLWLCTNRVAPAGGPFVFEGHSPPCPQPNNRLTSSAGWR